MLYNSGVQTKCQTEQSEIILPNELKELNL